MKNRKETELRLLLESFEMPDYAIIENYRDMPTFLFFGDANCKIEMNGIRVLFNPNKHSADDIINDFIHCPLMRERGERVIELLDKKERERSFYDSVIETMLSSYEIETFHEGIRFTVDNNVVEIYSLDLLHLFMGARFKADTDWCSIEENISDSRYLNLFYNKSIDKIKVIKNADLFGKIK